MLQSQILTTSKNKYIAQKVIIFLQIYVASGGGYTLPYFMTPSYNKEYNFLTSCKFMCRGKMNFRYCRHVFVESLDL